MSKNLGNVPITGYISPTDKADQYATHKAEYGQGGYRVVNDINLRDSISDDRREVGMLVYVLSDSKLYQLQGGIDNSNWVIASLPPPLPQDYILVGNSLGEAEASPALIDVNLEITSINEAIADLIAGSANNITLEGDVVGSGVGTIPTTLSATALSKFTINNLSVPLTDVNMNNQVIKNVGWAESGSEAISFSRLENILTTSNYITKVEAGAGISVTGAPNTPVINLTTTGVIAGTYTNPNVTVTTDGRLTSITSGSAGGGVTSVKAGTGITVTGTTEPTISLQNTSVTAGTYTLGNFTVTADGRLTSASSGSAVTKVNSGTGISVTGTTASPIINLTTTGVTAGTYTNPNVTVGNDGRLTSITSGSGGSSANTVVRANCLSYNNEFFEVVIGANNEVKIPNITQFKTPYSSSLNYFDFLNNNEIICYIGEDNKTCRITGYLEVSSSVTNGDFWAVIYNGSAPSGTFSSLSSTAAVPLYKKRITQPINTSFTLPVDTGYFNTAGNQRFSLYIGSSIGTTIRAVNMSWTIELYTFIQ